MNFNSDQQISIDIISRYIEGEIFLKDALAILRIKDRQFRRRVRAFRECGLMSIKHGNVGRSPSNKIAETLRYKMISLYRLKYFDFSVAHFREKLIELEEFSNVPSCTTIRKILVEEKLITLRSKRARKAYSRRMRYEQEGLMIQIDGSHHHWLFQHEPICLTAAIDDATGKLIGAKFTPTETTFAAMDVAEQIFKERGVFQMLYSDKAGIYGGGKRQGYSNMDRAMKELGVICVQANSPQAKGRVERLFGTLQNRLVQELRLAGIRDIDRANDFLKDYLPIFNEKFGRSVGKESSAYRPLNANIDLNEILCMKDLRRVSNGNVINYGGEQLVIESKEYLVKKQVEIRHYRDGTTGFFIDEKRIEVIVLDQKMAA